MRERGNAPGTRFADPYPWTLQVLAQSLVVLNQPPQLQLRHALFLRPVHPGRLCAKRSLAVRGVIDSTRGGWWCAEVREAGRVDVRALVVGMRGCGCRIQRREEEERMRCAQCFVPL